MPVLFDYLESELATFDQKPFGPLDSAVLSQACLIDGAGVVPTVPSESDHAFARLGALLAGRLPAARFADLMRTERFATMFVGLVPDDLKRCLFLLASSPRYRDLELRCYRSVFDDASHTQFCAMAFVWHDEFAYVGFRGTDASFTGWREDLDMAFKPRVRSQGLACSYLEEVADLLPSRLHVGGHSKGGNLALFAALSCSDRVRACIERVWCHDAPGFLPGTFTDEDYARLGGRVHRTVPQDSIVGMMLDCPIEPRVVESHASGILQHDVFSWEVDGDDFRYRDGLGDMSAVLHDVAAEWLASVDNERLERIMEAVSKAVVASGARDAREIFEGREQSLRRVAEVAHKLDPDSRDLLGQAIGDIANLVAKRLGRDVAAAVLKLWE